LAIVETVWYNTLKLYRCRRHSNSQDVVEGLREVDGYHQALLRVSCYGGQFTADGTIWREAIYWYDFFLLDMLEKEEFVVVC
jgi:hypothetical protein